ncbi:hypothetical protein L1N85_15290 [Paenibacillus alkaliterrae]|uniref:hypothetical protein n=1 Tax=Paenibacillus alkaliterrae TaxID=320909 RepID=UPI001F4683E3|nr:hypothetical protein [Paenibacillus alkaliterrae]MCF2939784.1 hypothetical protein [Paenibacillus alkaliterrae]
MRSVSSISPFLFDTDCISSFLWANKLDILYQLYAGQIFIPSQVEDELNRLSRFSHHKWIPELLSAEIAVNRIHKIDIILGTDEGNEFIRLTSANGHKPLGKGEAAVISWARFRGGTVASNNLRDVKQYCSDNDLGLISTDDILCIAHNHGIIDDAEANSIWTLMTSKNRKLPPYGFSEAYTRFINDLSK